MNESNIYYTDLLNGNNFEIIKHVETHKYYINQAYFEEISLSNAFISWNCLVQGPVMDAIDDLELDRDFPLLSPVALFLQVCRHWHYMKENLSATISVREATLDFGMRNARKITSRLRFRFKKLTV